MPSCAPLPQVPAWAHEKLERRARKAVLFLQQLTSAQLDADGVTKNPTMPASAIVSSQVRQGLGGVGVLVDGWGVEVCGMDWGPRGVPDCCRLTVLGVWQEGPIAHLRGPHGSRVLGLYNSKIRCTRASPPHTYNSQGIAVLTRNKYGALVTVENEYGFLIRKLAGPRNEIRWSAPVFLRGHFMGAGFSGGYQKYRTCVALANEQAVESALRGRSAFGPSVHFLLDMNGTRIRRARFDSNDVGTAYEEDRYGGKTANYYQVEAAMVDVSIHGGGASVDKDFNAAVYGRETSVDEILSSAAPPSEFELLYTVLQQFVEQSPGSRRREAAAPTRSIKPVRSIKMTSATASPEASPEQRDGQPLAS